MSEHTPPVLALEGIRKAYRQGGRELTVLHGVSLALAPGEIVALVGPSGSGKSTLLHIAGLLDTPDDGTVALAGEDMTRASDSVRTRARRTGIGFVYQFHHLLPECSALENVQMPQWLAGASQAAARERAAELLTALGLGERLTHLPSELSGGEQQRVAIARALANHPAVLLADEPTGNLDPVTSLAVFEALMKIAREEDTAMLLATHNHELARQGTRIVDITTM